MLEGKCPKCGYHCLGWALTNPEHQTCDQCGSKLVITEDRTKDGILLIHQPKNNKFQVVTAVDGQQALAEISETTTP